MPLTVDESTSVGGRSVRGTPTLLGVPYDEASSYARGAAGAPPRIREALHCESSNLWSELAIDLGGLAIVDDAGDVDLAGASDPRERIEAAVSDVIARGGRPVSLGGDHSVTTRSSVPCAGRRRA